MIAADALKGSMRWTAGTHVVFSVNFEEASLRAIRQDGVEVLMFKARSRQPCERQGWEAETTIRACVVFVHDGVHRRLRFR